MFATGSPTQPTLPVHKLPLEIYIKIFSLALSSDLRLTLISHLDTPISSPWALARVCTYWESIIYSTPSFWSSLVIDFLPISDVCAKRKVDQENARRLTYSLIRAVGIALTRSRDHPLQIALSSSSDSSAIQFLPEVLSLCLEHSKRWEGAYMEFWWDALDWGCPNLLDAIGRDADGNRWSFPQLRNLFLKGPGSVSVAAPTPRTSWLYIFQEAPSLSALHIKGDPHLVPELQGVLDWSQLTQFSTEMSSVDLFLKCCHILCACPKLAVFKLTLSPYPPPPQPNIEVPNHGIPLQDAELSELRDLWICLGGTGYLDLSLIFRTFPRTPRLLRMSLQPAQSIRIMNSFLPELTDFTSRSKCTITYLQIDHLPARQAMELFQRLPCVETLIAEWVFFDKTLIESLTTTPDGNHLRPGASIPVLLPKLKKAEIAGVTRAGLESLFVGIFESRRLYPAVKGGPTLEGADVRISLY